MAADGALHNHFMQWKELQIRKKPQSMCTKTGCHIGQVLSHVQANSTWKKKNPQQTREQSEWSSENSIQVQQKQSIGV